MPEPLKNVVFALPEDLAVLIGQYGTAVDWGAALVPAIQARLEAFQRERTLQRLQARTEALAEQTRAAVADAVAEALKKYGIPPAPLPGA